MASKSGGKGKKSRPKRGYRPPSRKIMKGTRYLHGPSGVYKRASKDEPRADYSGIVARVPPKRIKRAHRASGSTLSLKRWLNTQHGDDRIYLGVQEWRVNKQALITRRPGKIRKLGRVQA